MASSKFFTLLLSFFFFFFFSLPALSRVLPTNDVANGAPPPPSPTTTNFTYVCDTHWLASLGLDVAEFGFCNKSLSYEVRAKDLVDQMTISEKAKQLGDRAQGVARLGLPPYNWWSEALHGVAQTGHGTHFDNATVPGATNFPTPLLTTASFNETLWKRIGQVVSNEARAMYNLGLTGLTFWSPNINVARDPRWGRILETPGEDPYVVGRYAVNYVRGLQDVEGYEHTEDLKSRPLKVSSCCKHFAAYDIESWLGVDRWHFDARVSEQDMVETFLRPFEVCVKEGDVSSVMCSFNRVNGIPVCADPKLMAETFRGAWNLNGYIVSDCDSIEVIVDGHKWLYDVPEDAVAQVFRAGLDLDCGDYYTNFTQPAVEKGRLHEKEVDKALINLYVVLMRLGYFDGSLGDYDSLGKDDVCTQQNIDLAADAARQGIVLLKNNGSVLPLHSDNIKNIALVGPHANATDAMKGNYAGIPCRYVTPLDAFSEHFTVDYKMGCYDVKCKNDTLMYQAVVAAKHANATIIFVGLDLSVEAEGLDRTNLVLPGYQTQLITEVAESASGPVVLVVLNAGGLDISFAANNPKIPAIIWAGYPGGEGGHAILDVIFGHVNPAGRLPVTWYEENYVDMLPLTSMQLRPNDNMSYPGRTYKFFNGSVVYPFGHGLSYTNFTYEIKSATTMVSSKLGPLQHCHKLEYADDSIRPCPSVRIDDISCDSTIEFEVEVKNILGSDGDHVLIVYSYPPPTLLDAPIKQVVDFKRVFVPAGGSTTTKFSINVCKALNVVTKSAYIVLPSGLHTITIGDDQNSVSFPVHVQLEKSN